MLRLTLFTALALVLAACDTGDPGPVSVDVSGLSHDAASLVGTWDLIRTTSSGYGSPVSTSPVPKGTATYTFRADGTVDIAREGELVESTVYAVEELPGSFTSPLLRIGTETDYRREYFGVDGDRLYVDRRPSDGGLAEYRRR